MEGDWKWRNTRSPAGAAGGDLSVSGRAGGGPGALADPRALRRAAAKGEVIYDPRHFQRCLGVVLEGSVQVSKGALIMSVLKRGDLFGAAALFYQRPDYATTLTARSPCRLLLFPQALVEEWMSAGPRWGGAM